MNNKKKINVEIIIVIFFTLYLIYELTPYFTWPTFKSGLFGYLLGVPLQYIFGIIIVFAFFAAYKKIKISTQELHLCIGVLLLGFLHIVLCGGNFSNFLSSIWIRYLLVIIFIMLPVERKKQIYEWYRIVFALTLVPGLIYLFLTLLHINIPYDIIQPIEALKIARGYTYHHFPFAVQLHLGYGVDYVLAVRLCGMYNEAGIVGTLAALFLTAEGYKLKDRWGNIIILVAGIFSFSLAFYVMVLIYFVLINLCKHKFKNVIYLCFVILCFLILLNVEFDNPALNSIQTRLQISEKGLVGDNRTNDDFDTVFNNIFKENNPMVLLFGYGMGTIGTIQRTDLIDGSSVKCLIYDYGYIGLGLFIIWILWFVMICTKKKMNSYILVFLIIYLMNIYQRPTMFYPSFLCVFFGGCYYLREIEENT